MGEAKREKKERKARLKLEKKRLAAEKGRSTERPSAGARFADGVRGLLYVLLGLSLLGAIVLGQREVVVSLDDVISNLFVATAGKVVLGLIGLALAIYGLRMLRLLR